MAGDSRPFDFAAFSAGDWQEVFRQTVLFAEYQVRRLRWRGQTSGLLPEGFDANSIAAEAILEFLQKADTPDAPKALARAPYGETASPKHRLSVLGDTVHEIKRLALKQVSRLHHLKENFLLRNEADLCPFSSADAAWANPVELIPAPDLQPDEALIRKESMIEYTNLKFRFEVFLAKERRLIHLLDLKCDGMRKPRELAAHLKLGIRTVENLQKRLQRKWLALSLPAPKLFMTLS